MVCIKIIDSLTQTLMQSFEYHVTLILMLTDPCGISICLSDSLTIAQAAIHQAEFGNFLLCAALPCVLQDSSKLHVRMTENRRSMQQLMTSLLLCQDESHRTTILHTKFQAVSAGHATLPLCSGQLPAAGQSQAVSIS